MRYFTEDTAEASQLVVRGACLVGFSMEDYADPMQEDGATIRAEIVEAMTRWHTPLGHGDRQREARELRA